MKKRKKTVLEETPENQFLFSVTSMTEKDIVLNETAKTAKKPSFDFARYFTSDRLRWLNHCGTRLLPPTIIYQRSPCRA